MSSQIATLVLAPAVDAALSRLLQQMSGFHNHLAVGVWR